MTDEINKWDSRFLRLAEHISKWSRDPSTQTGAVITRPDKTICSVGYNGFPINMEDASELYNNRNEKYDRIIHCEMNAVINAKEKLNGYTLYVWPFISCSRCAVHMIQCGIARVVSLSPSKDALSRWEGSFDRTRSYFKECNVEVVEIPFSMI